MFFFYLKHKILYSILHAGNCFGNTEITDNVLFTRNEL